MKKYFLSIIYILFAFNLWGQYTLNQNKVWTFGVHGGINFTSGSPVPFRSSINTSEGCASVSDASGNLLFYSDGYTVFNRTGGVMTSGATIAPWSTSSTSQGATIIPVIGSASKYYLFSLEPGIYGGSAAAGYSHMIYCIVDMTLSAGLGDVVSSTARTAFYDSLSEKSIAIAGNDCNIWLLTHLKDSAVFLAFNVTSSGISSTPVRSHAGANRGRDDYSIGLMKASPNRLKVVTQTYIAGSSTVGTELYDFDPATGIVSGSMMLDSTSSYAYGAEFSPDNTKLYSEVPGTAVYQYDITGSTAAAIRATRYTVVSSAASDLKLGPDGKIYFGRTFYGSTISCISSPNNSGSGCGYVASAFTLTSGTENVYGLPNLFIAVGGGDTIVKHFDTVACFATGDSITLAADTPGTGYLWFDGATTSTHNIGAPGIYWVLISNSCTYNLDSFTVTRRPFDTTGYSRDTLICQFAAPATLSGPTGFASYTWEDGSTGSTHVAATTGTYWVAVSDSCGNVYVDTTHIRYFAPSTSQEPSVDTSACSAVGSIILTSATGFTNYTWNTGATGGSLAVSSSGTFWCSKRQGCTEFIDTFHVTLFPVPLVNLGNDTAVCVGTTLTLSSTQPAGYNLLWSNGTTGTAINVSTSGTYWLQVYDGCTATDSIHVTVSPIPPVNLGPDVFNCTGSAVTLSTTGTFTAPAYLWSDGSTSPADVVTVDGNYWLRVTEAGCSAADTVHVTIIYDTLHVYSRDTAICKGNVVQALASNNPDATFEWIPTAGIAVSNVPDALIAPDTSAMYILNMYVTGCPVVSDSFFIDVQPRPTVNINGGNRFVCQYDSLHLHANVSPAWFTNYHYAWSPATSLDDSNTQNVVFTAGPSQKYILSVTTPIGCKGIDSMFITVNPGNFLAISSNISLCPHDSAQLTAASSEGGQYHWNPSLYLSDATSATPWVHPLTSVTYELIGTSAAGCNDTAHVSVHVFPNGVIFMADSETIYPGHSFILNPTTNCVNMSWFPPTGLDNPTLTAPTAAPTESTRYWVTGTTQDGCKAMDSINIIVSDETTINTPNAFTPGGSANQQFRLILNGEANLNYIHIFNRWGNLVFTSTNINEGWDGTFNGKPQPGGVYIYELQAVTLSGNVVTKKGNVTLLR